MNKWTDEQAHERFWAYYNEHAKDEIPVAIGRALLSLEQERDGAEHKFTMTNVAHGVVEQQWRAREMKLEDRIKALEAERDTSRERAERAEQRAAVAESQIAVHGARAAELRAMFAPMKAVVEAAVNEQAATAQYYRGDANDDHPDVMQRYIEEGWTRFDALVTPARRAYELAVANYNLNLSSVSGTADKEGER